MAYYARRAIRRERFMLRRDAYDNSDLNLRIYYRFPCDVLKSLVELIAPMLRLTLPQSCDTDAQQQVCCSKIVMACMWLYNICREMGAHDPDPMDSDESASYPEAAGGVHQIHPNITLLRRDIGERLLSCQ